MCLPAARVFAVALCLFCGIWRVSTQTCRDLEHEKVANEKTIEKLRAELEEYKLGGRNEKDVSDKCDRFQTCQSCLGVYSHYDCGWCFLRNRCSLKEHCTGSDSDSLFWIPNGEERCPRISRITPDVLPYEKIRVLEVDIPNLPTFDGIFICSFDFLKKKFITKAERTDKGVACATPVGRNQLQIPGDRSSILVAVSVRTAHGPNFVSPRNITLYSCGSYESCTECTSSPFPCSWCIAGGRCTHDVIENCRNDPNIDSKAITQSIRSGPGFCSKILPNPPASSEILVRSGTRNRISVKTDNIAFFHVNMRFTCHVQQHGRVEAQLLSDLIYCDAINFKVSNRKALSNLTFNVLWDGNNKQLDNPQKIHVVVYECSLMATNCGACLELPDRYNCGWCEEKNSCMVNEMCGKSVWLDGRRRCTKPEITSIHPKFGLIAQETSVTIEGVNLGKEFKDIEVKLMTEEGDMIAQCMPQEELYVPSVRIVCILRVLEFLKEEANETLKGFFRVKVSDVVHDVGNEYTAVSEDHISFVNPEVTGIYPEKGVESGGTFLEIQGNHLDAGSTVEVFIGNFPCKIISRHSTSIQCITSTSKRTLSRAVRVVFDGREEEERTSPVDFYYGEDPWIRSVKTEFVSDGPRGTPSGGNLLIIEGENFDNVFNPPCIYVVVEGEEFIGKCEVESSTDMKCISPKVPADRLNFCADESFTTLHYGFKMDSVEEVQNISIQTGFQKFHMYSDPLFLPFEDEGKVKNFKSDYLLIKGKHIDHVFSKYDITVDIGSGKCLLTSLSSSQLICRPPSIQPPAKDGNSTKIPEVLVKIVDLMEFFVGYLRYS